MRFSLSSLVVVSALAAATPAFGQALSAQDEAQQRFQTGLKYYDQRDFESARLAFTQAYAVIQKPSILQNLAFSELYSNHPLEAVNHFDQYMKDPSVTADQKARAKRGLDEAMKKTGHYQVKLTPDSSLTVDGKAPPALPPSLVHVMPGSHVLESKLGAKSRNATQEAKAGETVNVDLTLDAVPAVVPPPPPPPAGASPPAPVTEPPHEAGYTESFWGWRSITGLAAVAAGAVFIGLSFSASSDESADEDKVSGLNKQLGTDRSACYGSSNALCTQRSEALQSRNDDSARAVTFRVVGIPLAVVGAGLVASAIIKPHRYEKSRTGFLEHLTPITGPKQAGFLFTSEF